MHSPTLGHWRIFFGLAATIAASAWIVTHFDLPKALEAIARVNPLALLWSLPAITLIFLLRARRWQLLVAQTYPVRFGPVYRSMMIGYLINNLVPAKAGELARAYLLGRSEAVSKSTVLGTVAAERVGDLAVLTGLIAVVLTMRDLPAWVRAGSWVAVALTAVGLSCLFLGPTLVRWLGLILGPRISAMGNVKTASGMLLRIAQGAHNTLGPRSATQFAALSVGIWCSEIFMAFNVARAFELPLGPPEATFLILMLAVGALVPAAVANIGPYEFFGVSALAALGIQGANAVGFILTLHALSIFGIIFLAISAVIIVPMDGATTAPRKDPA